MSFLELCPAGCLLCDGNSIIFVENIFGNGKIQDGMVLQRVRERESQMDGSVSGMR